MLTLGGAQDTQGTAGLVNKLKPCSARGEHALFHAEEQEIPAGQPAQELLAGNNPRGWLVPAGVGVERFLPVTKGDPAQGIHGGDNVIDLQDHFLVIAGSSVHVGEGFRHALTQRLNPFGAQVPGQP